MDDIWALIEVLIYAWVACGLWFLYDRWVMWNEIEDLEDENEFLVEENKALKAEVEELRKRNFILETKKGM